MSIAPLGSMACIGQRLAHSWQGLPHSERRFNVVNRCSRSRRICELKLGGDKKRSYRLTHAKPIVERFFAWVNACFEAQGWLPSNPLTKALAHARERRCRLEVYLNDPDVPIDTNHLERALRAVPMGRKNWLSAWTELGAKHVGIMHSLIVTCRLYQIDPYDYLVDVLQRVGQHPASRMHELTPRLLEGPVCQQPAALGGAHSARLDKNAG